jgi:hypothetical protein
MALASAIFHISRYYGAMCPQFNLAFSSEEAPTFGRGSSPQRREGARGSLFSCVTICPETMERPFDRLTVLSNVEGHQVFACFKAAPRSHITTATGILCACSPNVVRFGGGNRPGRILGDATEKRPPCTLLCVLE